MQRTAKRKILQKLNAVAKALKASSMKALRDFQRRQFGTSPITKGFCIVLERIIAQFLN